jgi:Nuclease-related domain
MPRLIPEQPTFTTTSEQEVWHLLKDGLGKDDVLLANRRLTDETKDHEADLIVLMPDAGIVVVEVKGGSVWCDEDGWKMQRGRKEARIDPVEQVRTTKYAFRDYVARDPR